mmetsp:Transcript_94988/g.307283  ORF Transcript_94988/g.307283 Transcript_94988/m.307283 type:complete len:422 (+) Transcript_94988:3050-4315(+)
MCEVSIATVEIVHLGPRLKIYSQIDDALICETLPQALELPLAGLVEALHSDRRVVGHRAAQVIFQLPRQIRIQDVLHDVVGCSLKLPEVDKDLDWLLSAIPRRSTERLCRQDLARGRQLGQELPEVPLRGWRSPLVCSQHSRRPTSSDAGQIRLGCLGGALGPIFQLVAQGPDALLDAGRELPQGAMGGGGQLAVDQCHLVVLARDDRLPDQRGRQAAERQGLQRVCQGQGRLSRASRLGGCQGDPPSRLHLHYQALLGPRDHDPLLTAVCARLEVQVLQRLERYSVDAVATQHPDMAVRPKVSSAVLAHCQQHKPLVRMGYHTHGWANFTPLEDWCAALPQHVSNHNIHRGSFCEGFNRRHYRTLACPTHLAGEHERRHQRSIDLFRGHASGGQAVQLGLLQLVDVEEFWETARQDNAGV